MIENLSIPSEFTVEEWKNTSMAEIQSEGPVFEFFFKCVQEIKTSGRQRQYALLFMSIMSNGGFPSSNVDDQAHVIREQPPSPSAVLRRPFNSFFPASAPVFASPSLLPPCRRR